MSIEMSVSEARAELSEVTNKVEYGGETVYLTKHRRRAVAVVPAAAAELLEHIEDLIDADQVRATLAALEDGTETRVPFSRRTAHQDG